MKNFIQNACKTTPVMLKLASIDIDFMEENMSKVCEVCGKGKMKGNTVSHSNRKANKHYDVNLQETTMEINGEMKKVKACTKCIKTSKKA